MEVSDAPHLSHSTDERVRVLEEEVVAIRRALAEAGIDVHRHRDPYER